MTRCAAPSIGFEPTDTSNMPDDCKIAVVAALERELWPLVKHWPARRREYDGRTFKFFETEQMVVVCGGLGSEAARRASEAVISLYHPTLLVSAGFAGALDSALSPGHTLSPRYVIDASDGSRTDSGQGEGVLLTFHTVADVQQKAKLAKAYRADAVDMEAAAVARAAEAHGLPFRAYKVISDAAGSRLPPVAQFVGPEGRFQLFKFLLYVAIRPWLWSATQRLARDSAMASKSLGEMLASAKQTMPAESQPNLQEWRAR
jgi:adenosylhomocysteine nucleosidase